MARECSIAMARERGLPMARECSLTKVKGRHCEERSDAAVHAGMKSWIATAYGIAMTKGRPRDDEKVQPCDEVKMQPPDGECV